MPGHLLLYHPGVRKLKELVVSGELGEVLCIYGNRQNLGTIRKDENALWSLGVHDLSVILHLLDEEPSEVWAQGNAFLNPGVEDVVFCFLRFPSGKIAHLHLSWLDPHKMRKLTVVGRDKMVVFDDMELERKVTIYEKGPEQPAQTFGEWQTRTRRHPRARRSRPTSRSGSSSSTSCAWSETAGRAPRRATDSRSCVCSSGSSTRSRERRLVPEIHQSAIVYPGTVLGEGVRVLEGAVVGKQPALSPRSTAARAPLAPASDRRRDHRLDRRDRVRRQRDRLPGDYRRPVVHPGARADRRRRRRRPWLAHRERHDDRRNDQDPGRQLTSLPTQSSKRMSSSRRAS